MSDKLNIEIITPDQTILKSKATEVTIPSFEGQMGILKNHIPLITFLRPGIISVKQDQIENKFKSNLYGKPIDFNDDLPLQL